MSDWRDLAACRGADTAIFYPDRGRNLDVAAAIAICAGCPVREPCLELGLSEKIGIFGGKTERQRRRLRRDQWRAPRQCDVCSRMFEPEHHYDKRCSDRCRRLHERRKHRLIKQRKRNSGALLDAGHGAISRYQEGCRCSACRRAGREARTRVRARVRAAEEPIYDPGNGEVEVA